MGVVPFFVPPGDLAPADHQEDAWREYVNNQTRGTRARFYGSEVRFLPYSKSAPDKSTSSPGAWYIRLR